jgi:hypothetical protein
MCLAVCNWPSRVPGTSGLEAAFGVTLVFRPLPSLLVDTFPRASTTIAALFGQVLEYVEELLGLRAKEERMLSGPSTAFLERS